jgi:hypothetical protein
MARKKVNDELKRRARPISLNDPEYERVMTHVKTAYVGMNFSQVARYLFEQDIQDFKETKKIRMGVVRKSPDVE